jgi:hypothetical protein
MRQVDAKRPIQSGGTVKGQNGKRRPFFEIISASTLAEQQTTYPRENNPSILSDAKVRIAPGESYSLNEVAELSGIPRKRWVKWVIPTERKGPKIKCFKRKGRWFVKGSEILRIMEKLANLPASTKSLQELASVLGRSVGGIKSNNMIWVNEERYFLYIRNSDGKRIRIPLYRDLNNRSLLLSERDYTRIRMDVSIKERAVEWEDAKDYMAEQGIDLVSAQLKETSLAAKLEFTEGKELYLPYFSPDGTVIKTPVFLLVRDCGNGRAYYMHREDLELLVAKIKHDQLTYITYQDALDKIGSDYKIHALTVKGREFSLDGKKYFIKLYRPRKVVLLYMRRGDLEVYLRWKKLFDKRQKDYLPVKKVVCDAFRAEDRRKKYAYFLSHLEERDEEIIFSIRGVYGLGVRIRELDGVYYVRRKQNEAIRFYLNAMHHGVHVRGKALKNLMAEVAAHRGKPDLILLFKLWTARELAIQYGHARTRAAIVTRRHLNQLTKNKKIKRMLEEFPIERFQEMISEEGSDLRCFY